MVKRRSSHFNNHVTWEQTPSDDDDDDDESSDSDSVRHRSPTCTDEGSSSEEEEGSESESESDVTPEEGSIRTSMARRIRGTSLIKVGLCKE